MRRYPYTGIPRKIFKMAGKCTVEKARCCSCSDLTTYECIDCTLPICNKCSEFEEDEETTGWVMGQSVGRCQTCQIGKRIIDRNSHWEEDEETSDTADYTDPSEPKPKRKR